MARKAKNPPVEAKDKDIESITEDLNKILETMIKKSISDIFSKFL